MFHRISRVYIGIVLFLAACVAVFWLKLPFLMAVAFYGIFLFLWLLTNKKSILRTIPMDQLGIHGHILISIFILAVILVCILPMGLSPTWNGRNPQHRNQYELLADSILNGHLYIDYDDIDPKLLAMENPYDFEEKIRQEVSFHFDHAFYNGHYYMYFGVVPVFFLFIPFKLIFGKTLVTFHATQFFVMFSILAFFLLFYMLAKKFFPKMALSTYLLVTTAICMITLGYCVQAPALYCTAISGGIFFMLWSLCFYFYGVFYEKREWLQVLVACLAALCGALAFGCRPPVALANLLAIPLASTYAREYKGKHLIRNFVLIAIPYVVVAGLLMTYNYLRFENPFEFGQAYQLTTGDQTIYMSFFDNFDFFRIIAGLFENFFTAGIIEKEFPHFFYGGFFVTYPLMWLIVIFYSKDAVHKELKRDRTALFALFLLLEPILVTAFDVYWAPGLCERYRLDAYFVVGILAFMVIGYRLKTTEMQDRTNGIVSAFAILSILMTVLLFLYPCDGNYSAVYPEKLAKIRSVLTFGLQ